MTAVEERLESLDRLVSQLQVNLGLLEAGLDDQKKKLVDGIMLEFAGVRIQMDTIVQEASKTFNAQAEAHQKLVNDAAIAVQELTQRVQGLEASSGARRSGDEGAQGDLPKKNTIPRKMDNKEDEWKQWKAEL